MVRMPSAHLCLEHAHAQESSAAAASKGLDTSMQSSHLEMPVSAGLALNPPSQGQKQMQNGDASGVRCVPALIAETTLHASERIRPYLLLMASSKPSTSVCDAALNCAGDRATTAALDMLIACSRVCCRSVPPSGAQPRPEFLRGPTISGWWIRSPRSWRRGPDGRGPAA